MIDIIKNTNLEYSINDTFKLPVLSLPGSEFSEGMQLKFVVSKSEQSDPIIEKTFNVNDDLTFTVTLTENEKKLLQIGEYIYKMITYKNNEIDTQISGYFNVIWGASSAKKKALILGNSLQFTVSYRAQIDLNTAARHVHKNKNALDKITDEMLNYGVCNVECSSEEEVASLAERADYKVFHVTLKITETSPGTSGDSGIITNPEQHTETTRFYIFNNLDSEFYSSTTPIPPATGSITYEQLKLSKDGLFIRTVTAVLVAGNETYTFTDWENVYPTKEEVSSIAPDIVNKLKYYGRADVGISDASLFSFDSPTGTITKYSGTESEVVIPYNIDGVLVTSIGECAFEYCKTFTRVTIPDSVTSIGDFAFYYCRSLTNVTIGNGVTSIGECAFFSCHSLTSIIIPDSVTNIGGSAFNTCLNLTSVTIPDSVTSIGDASFVNISEDAVFYVEQGSYADEWCKENEFACKYTEVNSDISKSEVKVFYAEITDGQVVETNATYNELIECIDATTDYSTESYSPHLPIIYFIKDGQLYGAGTVNMMRLSDSDSILSCNIIGTDGEFTDMHTAFLDKSDNWSIIQKRFVTEEELNKRFKDVPPFIIPLEIVITDQENTAFSVTNINNIGYEEAMNAHNSGRLVAFRLTCADNSFSGLNLTVIPTYNHSKSDDWRVGYFKAKEYFDEDGGTLCIWFKTNFGTDSYTDTLETIVYGTYGPTNHACLTYGITDMNNAFENKAPTEKAVIEYTSKYATKKELGSIDIALDRIIEIQNSLIGGDVNE